MSAPEGTRERYEETKAAHTEATGHTVFSQITIDNEHLWNYSWRCQADGCTAEHIDVSEG